MKKTQQQQLIILLLLVAAGYYCLVYLPEEEEKKKRQQQSQTPPKSADELKEEQEEDAWKKGRIWELPVQSWADRIVNGKKSSLLGEYQKYAGLFPDGDNHNGFHFSRKAPYTIYFSPSLEEYYQKGKELKRENCHLIEKAEDLILADKIKLWIKRVEQNPTRGEDNADGRNNNALFYGAPGTGKTATMKNICVETNKYPLVVIQGSDLTPTESDQSAEILPLHKFAYTISELEWSLEMDYEFEREDNGEVRYILFVDEANQISNNSLIFQPNELKFLKDCLEGIDKKNSSQNLWVFATNHKDQVEKATFRKGRLSNPLDFTWNWQIFKEYCERFDISLPERWLETGQLVPEDEKWLAEFNGDVFKCDFVGDDPDNKEKTRFWEKFIEVNPDAKYIPKNKQKEHENNESNDGSDEEDEESKEAEIEIGEFLEFFWHIREKYLQKFDGVYESVQKPTIEKILENSLNNLTRIINSKLDEIIEQLEPDEDDGEENIIVKLQTEVEILKDRVNELRNR